MDRAKALRVIIKHLRDNGYKIGQGLIMERTLKVMTDPRVPVDLVEHLNRVLACPTQGKLFVELALLDVGAAKKRSTQRRHRRGAGSY